MCSVFDNEFHLHNFWLNFDHPEYFTSPQWRWPRPVYLIYRFVLGVYTVCTFIYMVIFIQGLYDQNRSDESQPRQHTAMVYMTSWSYLMLTIHCVVAFVISIVCHRTGIRPINVISSGSSDITSGFHNGVTSGELNNVSYNASGSDIGISNFNEVQINDDGDDSAYLRWYSKLSWVLANISSSLTAVVTAVYFAAIFKPSSGLPFNDVNTHILNTVFVIVDLMISARPVRLLHFIYPVIFGIMYTIFSAIYWAIDRSNVIYPMILDWNNAGITVGVICGVIVLIMIFHGINFALYSLRMCIYHRIYTLRG